MRKVILMLLLALISSNAMANWIWINSSSKGKNYAEPDSIQVQGSIVQIQVLTDMKRAAKIVGSKPFLSVRALNQYNCDKKLYRTIVFRFYSGNMGKGDIIRSENTTSEGWKPVLPNSMNEDLFSFACKRITH